MKWFLWLVKAFYYALGALTSLIRFLHGRKGRKQVRSILLVVPSGMLTNSSPQNRHLIGGDRKPCDGWYTLVTFMNICTCHLS
ncbi:hypothetical protein [Mechercharimyces sp. CAU 1602]|uniref:hypothetical protein n=1 Tax=Mechercharimyces sp. CAU 1602 TaxID=2973933 RepID=UPI0021613DE3|nr:hypothetical protein [Mechercharimyces sp. CAU 1602]MCS1351339.1 hypothetical protein [Mechercharimyces sp. CAU 1602]